MIAARSATLDTPGSLRGADRRQVVGIDTRLALPERAGSPLSINALREDLQVAHATVAGWLDILERLYAVFRLASFGAPRRRAVRKEQKHQHMDCTLVPDPAARFENCIACHLLKWVHHQQDTGEVQRGTRCPVPLIAGCCGPGVWTGFWPGGTAQGIGS